MTKAELFKKLEPYPDDTVIAGYNKDGASGERYYMIRAVKLVRDIEWIDDIIKGVESKPSLILMGRVEGSEY